MILTDEEARNLRELRRRMEIELELNPRRLSWVNVRPAASKGCCASLAFERSHDVHFFGAPDCSWTVRGVAACSRRSDFGPTLYSALSKSNTRPRTPVRARAADYTGRERVSLSPRTLACTA
jgi:hypothetical protein